MKWGWFVVISVLAGCAEQQLVAVNVTPEAEITSHEDGDTVREGELIGIRGLVLDAETLATDLEVSWYLGETLMCSDVPSNDGTTNCNLSVTEGNSTVLLEVHDVHGAIGSDAVQLEVIPDETPVVEITSPTEGESFYADEAITFAGVVADAEDDPTDLEIEWTSTLDGGLPLSSIPDTDGAVGGGITLSEGEHTVQLSAQDSLGNLGVDSVSVSVRPANRAPTCQIDSPISGAVLEEGESVLFEASVDDLDQDPASLEIVWTSDIDGDLGLSTPDSAGGVILQSTLTAGSHLVTLQVVDERGAVCSDYVLLDVSTVPSVTIDLPLSGTVVDAGTAVSFEVSVADGEDDPEDLTLVWSSDVDGVFSNESPNALGEASVAISTLSHGAHAITVLVEDTDGMSASDAISLTINGLPSQPSVSISPDPAYTANDLTAVVDVASVDPEGSPVSYSYSWSKDGQVQSAYVSATVPASATLWTQQWAVTVTPTDGISAGPSGTASIVVSGSDTGTAGGDTSDTSDTSDTAVDTDTDLPTDTGFTIPPVGDYTHCTLPATYSRITHGQGNVDLTAVAYEPHGDYALVLGYPSEIYRYDPAAQTLDHIASGGGDYWNAIEFAPDGSYALIGGADGYTSPDPVLYVYTEAAGLSQITGITSGGLYTPSRIGAIAHRPGTDSFAILSDNTGSWPSQVTYIHEFTPDFSTGTHSWVYGGGQVSDQNSSSVAWGENLGQQIALGTDYYLELFYYDPSLTSGNFSTLSTNTGNLKKVLFNPEGSIAWVLQWSSNGKIYTWEGALRTDYDNTYDFSGYTIWDFNVSPDGHWKVFVGRYGNVYWSDSDWRPVDHSAFTQQEIANFDQPPYSASTNDYLHGVSWRPDTCNGLMVGDATSSQGTLILFELQ